MIPVSCLAAIVGTPADLTAQAVPDIQIVSAVSGEYLEVNRGRTDNNVQIVQLGCYDSIEQKFTFKVVGAPP
jgi:hypothetical protein